MKKLIVFAILMLAGAVHLKAADLVFTRNGSPESSYVIFNSSVAVASTTTSIEVSTLGYRAVYIFNVSASTMYYRIDGSTQNTALVGYPILPNTEAKIETNGLIGYQLAPGAVATVDVRKKIIQK